jgi:ubiquinone/menaquinone biosynthesis C-methylase UbiE
MTTQPVTDLTKVKARQQESWATGDIPLIARPLVGVAENLCETVELRPGQRVLDVATCTGNVALGAARRFCEVTGIDYTPNLLEVARERAAVERLQITFLEADAEHLPFPNDSFDVVLSALGVMFAPDQEQAANELLRVCRPGGKIGLVNWTPEGFFGKMGAVMQAYAPAPQGLKQPGLWGTEKRLHELFGDEVTFLYTKRRYFFHRYYTIQHAVDVTCNDFGPAVTALQALDPVARERLSQDMRSMFEQANQANDGTVIAPTEYLEVVAVRH